MSSTSPRPVELQAARSRRLLPAGEGWARFRRHRLASIGLAVIVALVTVALLAPLLVDLGLIADPRQIGLAAPDLGPSLGHPLGTDSLGRDLLSRLVFGARVSLSIAALVQGAHLAVGGGIGVLAGYLGGWVDRFLMRLTDAMYAFPALLFMLFLASVLGPGYWHIVLALALIGWVRLARVVRAQVMAIKSREFVEAARASGSGPWSVVFRHVLANALGPVIVVVTLGVPGVIFSEAFVSFVGLGVSPGTPSWGVMASDAYEVVLSYPIQALVRTAAIALTTLAFQFLGDGLRDALDPTGTAAIGHRIGRRPTAR